MAGFLERHRTFYNKTDGRIGTSYLAQFQKRAVTNLKNYSTKNYENLQKPKAGQCNSNHHEKSHSKRANISTG